MLSKIRSLRDEREHGFTLIELLVVILIIGILAAIAIPAFMNQRKVAVDATVESDVRNTFVAVTDWTIKNHGKAVPRETHIGKDGATTAFINAPLATLVSASVPKTNVLDVKVSPGNGITIAPNLDYDQVGQYCAYGFNASGDRSATTPGIIFDSAKGGMTETGWCAENVPTDVEDWLPGTGSNPDTELEVPVVNQFIIDDRMTSDKIVAEWQFVKSYSMINDSDTDRMKLKLYRESDGQPVNGTLYVKQGSWSPYSEYSLVENGNVTRRAFADYTTGIPYPITGKNDFIFSSRVLGDSSIHEGSALNEYSFNATGTYKLPTKPDSVQGAIQLFGENVNSIPTSISGSINVDFPEKAEGRRLVKVTGLTSTNRSVWDATGYMVTTKSGITEFHTSSINEGPSYDSEAQKLRVQVVLDDENIYQQDVNI